MGGKKEGRENDEQPRKGEEVSGSAGLGHWLLLGSAHSLSHTASTVVVDCIHIV